MARYDFTTARPYPDTVLPQAEPEEGDRLFAAAIIATVDNLEMTDACLVLARDLDAAGGVALQIAHVMYPSQDGFRDHRYALSSVSDEHVIAIARLVESRHAARKASACHEQPNRT